MGNDQILTRTLRDAKLAGHLPATSGGPYYGRMRHGILLSLACAALLAGACGHSGGPYSEQASLDHLVSAGWKATSAHGMPNTVSGLPQVGYLQMTSPDGVRLDAQFMEDAAAAQKEAAAAGAKLPGFRSVVIGNVLVFTPPDGAIPVNDADRTALTSLLA